MVLRSFGSHPHATSDPDSKNLFARGKGVIVNYHGYPHDVAGLVFGCEGVEKMYVEGYREEFWITWTTETRSRQ